jgi:Secretion system C-terminal sorting domain
MKQLQQVLLIKVLLLGIINLSEAQTLNYTTVNYPITQCNVFNVSPARVVSGLTHYPVSGGVSYNGSALVLQTKGGQTPSTTLGTAYAIAISIKQGYSYNITVNASEQSLDPVSAPFLEIGAISSLLNPNTTNPTACGAVDQNKWSVLQSTRIGSAYINNTNPQNYPIVQDFIAYANLSYFTILAHSGSQSQSSIVLINSITVVETAPSPAFTLSPSSVSISCGSTTPVTFTATGSNIPSGATVTYSWNLGAAPNGWLYNGSPAPQTVSTGSTNTLTLTPVCGATQSNISATTTVNSTNYNTNSSAITVTPPSLTIDGANSFCLGTSVYSLAGTIPCGTTVTWSATPSGILSLSPSGNTVTATQVGDGIATLTATINACNNFAVSLPVAVGAPDRPKVLNEMGEEITTVSTCTNTHKSLCPTIDSKWNILEWEWEKVTGNFNLLDFESCADILGFQPGFGFISVRVRNACGWSNPTFIVVYVNDCSGMGMQQKSIKLFPNPVSSSVTLSVDNRKTIQLKGKEKLPAASINEVKVYDNSGSVKLYRKFIKQPTATLDVSRLPKGIYTVEVNTGSGVEYQQLIIQR